MPEQNLNPDAVAAATMAVISDDLGYIETMSGAEHVARLAVSSYLSALPAHPDTVTTLAELEALPNCSAIVDKFGDAGLIEHDHVKFAETAKLPMAYVAKRYLPATVIYRPVK